MSLSDAERKRKERERKNKDEIFVDGGSVPRKMVEQLMDMGLVSTSANDDFKKEVLPVLVGIATKQMQEE